MTFCILFIPYKAVSKLDMLTPYKTVGVGYRFSKLTLDSRCYRHTDIGYKIQTEKEFVTKM